MQLNGYAYMVADQYEWLLKLNGGEGEIRTPEELSPLPVFETGTFDHSVTSPCGDSDEPPYPSILGVKSARIRTVRHRKAPSSNG